MQEVGSLLEVLQRYFEQDIIVILIIAALPWLVESFSKKQKLFLSGVAVGILLLFNAITFWLMSKLGENETYYRFFWALPCGCILAFLLIKLWEEFKEKWQKGAFALILVIAAFMHSDINISNWIPRDLWYLSEETMQLAELIAEDSGKATRTYLYDYSDLTYGIREYDANIILVDDGVENALYFMFAVEDGNTAGRIICSVVINNNIEYVYLEKEKEIAQRALVAGGALYVGETTGHRVYKFDLEEMQAAYNVALGARDDVRVWGIEYMDMEENTTTDRFIYYTDGGVQLVDENIEFINKGLSGEEEYQVLDLGEYYICTIDNSNGMVSTSTVEQFEDLNRKGKPIILLLTNPLPDGKMDLPEITDVNMLQLQKQILDEDTMVCKIYAREYIYPWRSQFENGVEQCVCLATDSTGNTIITVRGK